MAHPREVPVPASEVDVALEARVGGAACGALTATTVEEVVLQILAGGCVVDGRQE